MGTIKNLFQILALALVLQVVRSEADDVFSVVFDEAYANIEPKDTYLQYLDKCRDEVTTATTENPPTVTEPPYDFCDPHKHLICPPFNVAPEPLHPKCICDNATSYYDRDEQMCLVEVGKDCMERTSSSPPTKCTPNAYCDQPIKDQKGKCKCHLNSIEDLAAGLCVGAFSAACMKDNDCAINSLLKCEANRTCGCTGSNSIWTPEGTGADGVCKSLLRGECDTAAPIPPNPVKQRVCVDQNKMDCISGACLCNPAKGYIEFEQQCFLDFDQICVDDNDCLPSNVCNPTQTEGEKKCGCRENVEVAEDKVCKLKAGQVCDSPQDDRCHLNSECSDAVTGGEYKCTCNANSAPDSNSICKLNHGVSCDQTNPLCNEELHLTCGQGGSCECKADYEFDTASSKCLGNLDAVCGVDEDCKTGSCIQDGGNMKCGCPSNTISDNGCFLGNGETCPADSEWECYGQHYLQCIEGICQCNPQESVKIPGNDACMGLADTDCSNGITCIPNAYCAQIEGQGRVCTCVGDFVKNATTNMCDAKRAGGGSWAISGSFFGVLASFVFVAVLNK